MSNTHTKNRATFLLLIISFVLLNICMVSRNNQTVNYDHIEIYKLKKESRFRKVNIKTNIKYKIIHGSTSSEEINLDFERKLLKFGYKKSNYNPEKLNKIVQTLNSFKNGISSFDTSCLPTYREIIIYKKNNKIIKVIKICTSCFENEVISKNKKTELLLFIPDYELLEEMFEE